MSDVDFQYYRAEMLTAVAAAKSEILSEMRQGMKRLYGNDDVTTGDINIIKINVNELQKWRDGWGGVAQLLALLGGGSGIILLGITLAKAIAK